MILPCDSEKTNRVGEARGCPCHIAGRSRWASAVAPSPPSRRRRRLMVAGQSPAPWGIATARLSRRRRRPGVGVGLWSPGKARLHGALRPLACRAVAAVPASAPAYGRRAKPGSMGRCHRSLVAPSPPSRRRRRLMVAGQSPAPWGIATARLSRRPGLGGEPGRIEPSSPSPRGRAIAS